jgi:putative ABC transport system substrate-binding protein
MVTLTLSLLTTPLATDAQQAGKVPRLGVLFPMELPSPEEPNFAAFRQALRHLGYVEGQTIALESRYALGRGERFPELIAELLQLQMDILVVGSARAAVVAKQATQALPIVFLGAADPVETGLVASLAQPGGNLTGLSFAFSEGFGGKWVEFLKETVPNVSQVAFLQHPASGGTWLVHDIQRAAQALGVTPQTFWVSEPAEIDDAFATLTAQRVGALIVGSHFSPGMHHTRFIDLAAHYRLPAMYPFDILWTPGDSCPMG